MSLLRKKPPASQAERLAAWRLASIASHDHGSEIGDLLTALGLEPERKGDVWFATVGPRLVFFKWHRDVRVLAGFAGLDDTQEPRGLTNLLPRNLDPGLVWFALDDPGEDSLGVRFNLPMDAFDRDAALLGLETLARLVGDDDVAEGARTSRARPAGEME